MREVIDKGSTTASHPVPLLFVHGAYHAAWCWDENFVGYFADKGFRALAVSLRGHGQSTRCKPLRSCSIADYVEDVRAVADKLGCEPVPIGHSMGCLVVEKYLEKYRAPSCGPDGTRHAEGGPAKRVAHVLTSPMDLYACQHLRQLSRFS